MKKKLSHTINKTLTTKEKNMVMKTCYNTVEALPIEKGIPIPSRASKTRTRLETNPLRSLRETEIGDSVLVPIKIIAKHILDTHDTEHKKLKALDQRITSYTSRMKRDDDRNGRQAKSFRTRAEFGAEGVLLGIRVWRVA